MPNSTSETTLLLLHGLGGNGQVWAGLRALASGRETFAPDLPGHGTGPGLTEYSIAAMAEALAETLGRSRRYEILGHSLGGVLALALADRRHGLHLARVVGVGIKATWTPREQARAAASATRPPEFFDTREQALTRFLAAAGLAGLVDTDSAITRGGLREQGGRWRTTTVDSRVTAAGAPDMGALLAGAGCPVTLARGEHDPVCAEEGLRTVEAETGCAPHVTLTGLGHHPHVEDPDAVMSLL